MVIYLALSPEISSPIQSQVDKSIFENHPPLKPDFSFSCIFVSIMFLSFLFENYYREFWKQKQDFQQVATQHE